MPEDTRKNSQKGKNDPKEQRRRRGRQHAAPVEKKVEKEPVPQIPKVTEPEKPPYEPPGPEFYKSLKRETDEILKITEEANTKYKKKEIQSNWAKYEMPIETYEEIDEQENLGADYEALIQAPLSVGGHFQFKHEKSWDLATGPTAYDKYFDINMENLTLALCTIPFYERNCIDQTIFNENDIQTMNHRATKFKQKYYNNKNFTTPDLEAHDKILSNLKSETSIEDDKTDEENNSKLNNDPNNDKLKEFKDINLEECEQEAEDIVEPLDSSIKDTKVEEQGSQNILNTEPKIVENVAIIPSKEVQEPKKEITQNIVNEKPKTDEIMRSQNKEVINVKKTIDIKLIDSDFDEIQKEITDKHNIKKPEIKNVEQQILNAPIEKEPPKVTPTVQKEVAINPIIESPEDLEKWLDDFLDG